MERARRSKTVRFLDRSRMEADWECPRLRYLNYEIGGRGVQPKGTAFDLEFGTIVHDGIEAAVQGKTANTVQRVMELVKLQGGEEWEQKQWAGIGFGLVAGFMRSVWPKLMEQYELVSVEREVGIQLTEDLLFQARPDLLLRNKSTKLLWYFELKTAGNIDMQWCKSWERAPQVHLGALACERELGESLAGVVVVGLYKGRKSYGKQSSPLAWGYRTEDMPGIVPPQFSYEEQRRKGWEKFLAFDHPGGIEAWVANMPEELLAKQFVLTEPIFLRRDVTDRLIAQALHREQEIAAAMQGELTQDVVDRVFPQHFSSCAPAFGHGCKLVDACWIPWVAKNPLASGMFEWREPHHEAERKFFELKEVA